MGSQPLTDYFESGPDQSHGIVAVSPDGNDGWFFTTGKGRLYHETPGQAGPFTLIDMGWIHPARPRYAASMFRDEKSGTFYAVATSTGNGGRAFEWIARAADGTTTVAPFPYGDALMFPGDAVVYGSMTHDFAGRFYVVGTMNYKPVVLQVTPAR